MPHIFVSFANDDRDIATEVCALLRDGCGLSPDQIFSTSERGRFESAEDFVARIRRELTTATLTIHLLTPQYFQSEFCMAELGGAWAINMKRILVLVPPAAPADLKGILAGSHVLKIDDEGDLDQIAKDVWTTFDLSSDTMTWNECKRHFLRHWPDLSRHVARPDTRPNRTWTPATERDVSFAEFAQGAKHVFMTSGMVTRALPAFDGDLGHNLDKGISVRILLPSIKISTLPFDEDGLLTTTRARRKRIELIDTLAKLQDLMQRDNFHLKFATFSPTATVFIADAWSDAGRLFFLPLLYRSYDFWRVAATVTKEADPDAFFALCSRFGALWDDGDEVEACDLEPIIDRLDGSPVTQ